MGEHPGSLLGDYADSELDPALRPQVDAHLARCAACRDELAGWVRAAAALRVGVDPPAGDVVGAALWHSVLHPDAVVSAVGPWGHLRVAADLLRTQLRLVAVAVWAASAMVMVIGAALAAGRAVGAGGWVGDVLAVVAPIVAAAGIAGVCGPGSDLAFEVASATPTSPRVVLLARITVVFGYDLALAVAVSAVLTVVGVNRPGLGALTGSWFGPMAVLAALSLLIAVWRGSTVAVTVAAGVWLLRVLGAAMVAGTGWARAWDTVIALAWSTNLFTVVLAVTLVSAAVGLAGRGERFHPALG